MQAAVRLNHHQGANRRLAVGMIPLLVVPTLGARSASETAVLVIPLVGVALAIGPREARVAVSVVQLAYSVMMTGLKTSLGLLQRNRVDMTNMRKSLRDLFSHEVNRQRAAVVRSACHVALLIVVCAVNSWARDAAGPTVEFNEQRFSHLSSAEIDLLHEYYDAYWKLKDFYGNLTITARGEVWALPPTSDGLVSAPVGTPLKQRQRLQYQFFARHGSAFRLEVRSYDPEAKETFLGGRVGIINGDDCFLFGIDKSNGKPFLEAQSKNLTEAHDIMASQIFPVAAYALRNRPIEQIVFSTEEGWPIESVERVPADSEYPRETVVIKFVIHNEKGLSEQRLRLDSTRGWVTLGDQGFSTMPTDVPNVTDRFTSNFRCEYDPPSEPFPRLKRVVMESYVGHPPIDDRKITHRAIYEIDKLDPGSPAASRFDAQQLREPALNLVQPFLGRYRLLLAVNGLLLLGLGGWMMSRRHNSPVEQTRQTP